ncbi:Transmembrane transporter [Lachnellula hyalina]|uniref:Transmembrane transporter n=1 Tax=Lachnellula hyalina TaxID=1316788 RepID=A0A8H8R6S1_9HELO|nr:Transmembrane transporter [Lachnellula hyalina]TVY28730.1 Transmembrane transporter [Lachnellula hyalina]
MDIEKSLPDAFTESTKHMPADFSAGQSLEANDEPEISQQQYGIWSLLGMGYSVSNTAMSLTASLITGIGSGGVVVFTWGQIMIFAFSICVACSLAELASAFPHPGGQYYWASQLAPKSIRRGISYLVGLLSWAGVVVTCASGTLAIPQMITILVIACTNIVESWLLKFSLFNMWWSVVSIVIILISGLAASPTEQSGSFVFTEFINTSGWEKGIAFLTGMLGSNW